MQISFGIDSKEFKRLPLVCKCSYIINMIAVIIMGADIPLSQINNSFFKEHNILSIGFIILVISFIVTVIFDKDIMKHIKIGVLKRPPL